MHVVTCRRCGQQVEAMATWCPNCGRPLQRFDGPQRVMVGVLTAAFVILLIAILWGLIRR
jgi:hypothetical protein